MTLEQLRARLQEILTELRSIHATAGDAALTPEQGQRFDTLDAERATVEASIAREERRAALAQAAPTAQPAARAEARTESGDGARRQGPAVHVEQDPREVLRDRSLTGRARSRQLTDAILRANESLIEDGGHQRNFERLLKKHSRMQWWAENLLARSTEQYHDAFEMVMTGRSLELTDEQRAAIAVGTTTQGGYLVPTHLDPTIMITSSGSANPMRQFASVKTLVDGKTWNGVTSAGVTASWDAELTEVSDDSPTVAQASISVNKPQAWIGASIEAFEDITGLTSDVLMLFADARDTLEGAAHMTGSGTSATPKGLFTAVNASTTLRITSTTAATIGEVDLSAVKVALPQRFRKTPRGGQQGAMWVMNPTYAEAIRRLGSAVSSAYSGDLTQPTAERIKGYNTLESDDAPSTQTTTALDQEIVFGDLRQYGIVDKPGGTSIEFVPVTFGSNGLPNGGRGWYMHWRTGADALVLNAFRILVDKTSA